MVTRFILGLGLASVAFLSGPALAASGQTLQIVVSRETQSLAVYDGDQVIATSRVSTGKAGHSTPTGIFSIIEKRRYHESNLYSNAPMPFMQRITWSGIALHESTSVPKYPASHGCVRLPKDFARTLYGMTARGAHVIIADAPIAPSVFTHAALLLPRQEKPEGQLLSDASLRPSMPDGDAKPVELAMNAPAKATETSGVAEEKPRPPVRILITRRGPRETMMDVQTLLNGLGYPSGIPDGLAGSITLAAIAEFKTDRNLAKTGPAVTPEFLEALYAAAGKGKPPEGQIFVRQDSKPVFEAAIGIRDPQIALGTHFIEAMTVDVPERKVEWTALSIPDHLPSAMTKRLGITEAADAYAYNATGRVLDRLTIPDDVRSRIELLLSEGSSITITDRGIGPETGDGTDFITLTGAPPRERKS